MKIVIDIPEEDYKSITKQVADGITNPLKMCIANGKPLPRRRCRLIDAVELLTRAKFLYRNYSVRLALENAIDHTPTIIEVDETENENKDWYRLTSDDIKKLQYCAEEAKRIISHVENWGGK